MPSRNNCALLIAAAVVVSFGILSPWVGFFCDDWAILRPMILAHAHTLGAAFAAFNPTSFWYMRPGDMLYHPFMYWLCGLTAWRYQAIFLACDAASAVLLFSALDRASGERRLSFLTALLFAVYPNHAATHHWFAAVATPALAAVALSFEFFSRWLERRSPAALAGAWFFFALGALTYEAVLPLVLLYWMLGAARGLRLSQKPRAALREGLARSWTFLILSALLFGYHIAIARLFPRTLSRALVFDPKFALSAMGRGWECAFTGVIHLIWVDTPKALADLPLTLWLVGGAACAAVTAGCLKAVPVERSRAPLPAYWAAAGVLLTLACYAPYAVSADRYVPHIFDEQNRLNAAASIGAAMVLGAGLAALGGRGLRLALGPILIAFTIVNWRAGWDWKLAWDLETKVLSGLIPKLAAVKGPALIVVDGPPHAVGGALVFGGWSVDAAVQCMTARSDLHAGMPDQPTPGPGPRLIYRAASDTLTAN